MKRRWLKSFRLFVKSAFRPDGIEARDEATARALRRRGVRVGAGCRIYTSDFSTEPFLVKLGDRVLISGGVRFLTHDGSARLLAARRPMIQAFGKISVGDDTFIGENSVLLPGTTVGSGCIIGAGAVVRGTVPANSLVVGNPGKVVGRASVFLERLLVHPDALDTLGLPERARNSAIRAHFGMEKTHDARSI